MHFVKEMDVNPFDAFRVASVFCSSGPGFFLTLGMYVLEHVNRHAYSSLESHKAQFQI